LEESLRGDEPGRAASAAGVGSGERTAEADRGAAGTGHRCAEGCGVKKVVSASAKRQVGDRVVEAQDWSQRRACHSSGIARSTVRYQQRGRAEEAEVTATVRGYVQRYPQHGYRHITALMQRDGHQVNHKRIERLWRQEGLQLPRRKTVKRRYGEK